VRFRDHVIAAPLKLNDAKAYADHPDAFPRSRDRGSIEATCGSMRYRPAKVVSAIT